MKLPEPGDLFAVMYHYVRPREASNLHYLNLDAFGDQLDLFSEKFGIVTADEWHAFRRGAQRPTGALLTFDDGLKDHLDHVAPALKSRGLWAMFFCCTDPLRNKPLHVHLTHYLLAHVEPIELERRLVSFGWPENWRMLLDPVSLSAYDDQRGPDLEKDIKRFVNWALQDVGQGAVLIDLFHDIVGISPNEFCGKWYLNEADLKTLAADGFEVGSHTCSHKVLANQADDILAREIGASRSVLQECSQGGVKSFCYPYGGPSSYDSRTIDAVRLAGYSEAFSVHPSPIRKHAFGSGAAYSLPRYDCSQFLE